LLQASIRLPWSSTSLASSMMLPSR
jgi:hypothetical protein